MKARPETEPLFSILDGMRQDADRRFWIERLEAAEDNCDTEEDLEQVSTGVKIACPGGFQSGRFIYTEENMCQLLILLDKSGKTKYTLKHKLIPLRKRPVERLGASADACTIVELLAALIGGPQPIETADTLLAHFCGRLSDLRYALAHEIAGATKDNFTWLYHH